MQKRVFVAHAGEHIGAIAILSHEPSLFSSRARTDSVVVCFSSEQFAAISSQYPQALFALTELLIRRLSPFMRAMDYAIDWVHLEGGHALFRHVSSLLFRFLLFSSPQLICSPSPLTADYHCAQAIGGGRLGVHRVCETIAFTLLDSFQTKHTTL